MNEEQILKLRSGLDSQDEDEATTSTTANKKMMAAQMEDLKARQAALRANTAAKQAAAQQNHVKVMQDVAKTNYAAGAREGVMHGILIGAGVVGILVVGGFVVRSFLQTTPTKVPKVKAK